jgi:hypothetical protein
MMRARSVGVSPNTNNDRISRSKETDGSPASILATRDWLDFSRFANSTCVSFWLLTALLKLGTEGKFELNIGRFGGTQA